MVIPPMAEPLRAEKVESPLDNKRANLTRIPAKHLYFADNLDLKFGSSSSQISNLECGPGAENRPYYEAAFLPSWQQWEITLHRPGAPPDLQYLHASNVKRWLPA